MLNLLLKGQENKDTLCKHKKILWGRVGVEGWGRGDQFNLFKGHRNKNDSRMSSIF